MEDLQKINVKVFLDVPRDLASGDRIRGDVLDRFLPIFAGWREDSTDPTRWVDLADYAHMTRGPGVMIVGHRGNLAVDLADPGPGLLYANKLGLDGPLGARIHESFRRGLELFQRLVAEPEYPVGLTPRAGSWQLAINDRLRAPNTDQTHAEAGPAMMDSVRSLLGDDALTAVREPDPSRRYGFTIHSDRVSSLDALLERTGRAVR